MTSKENLQQKLKGLSLDQKRELLETLKKKELLKKEQTLATFKPHAGQKPFFESKARIVAAFCGNGWGKTTALTLKIIYAHNPGHNPYTDTANVRHSWLVVPGLDKTEDYWQEIKKWCPPSLLPKPNKLGTSNIRRFDWPNGTMTTIYSHDQDSGKLEGTNIDALFCDEPLPRSLWIAAFRGLRNNPDYFVIFAGTLVSEPWIYEEIYLPGFQKKDSNIEVILGSTYDNPFLSKDFVKDFESRLTDDEKKVRLHGEPASLQGRVFKEFSRRTHVFRNQSWPTDWPVYCAIDPHPRKPNTAVYLGVTPDDIMVVLDELVVEGTPTDFAKALMEKEKLNGYKIICRRIDNSGSGTDWNRDSFIAQLDRWSRENKYNVRVSPMRKAEKDVASSIHKIRILLKDNKLRFLDNCVETISDMELYAWQDFRHPEVAGIQEKPRKIHDDMIDPLRYIIVSNPVHSPSLGVISTLQNKNPYNRPQNGHPHDID